ncbi:tRNA (adenosine(37)-N6)-dimethylallyltransferase MiaA [Candidatus Pelagibacter sp.]|nr:tRNA (adenosine(37)-N6)-dimethylallyltransferase MiaA [Candidatus Pelagibacter sp.]
MDLQSKIILISGPTASGKSSFAVNLAEKINGEIINADSMQVYKEVKILTARPTIKDQKKIKHHLYGFISIKRKFSTGQWLKHASNKINEIREKNKVPILVGGTGLYFRALIEGLVRIPKISAKKRKIVSDLQKKLGQINFYKSLIKLDPKIKKIVNQNDYQRSIRAYEVKKFTRKSLVDWHKDTKPIFMKDTFVKLYVDCSKDLLLERIKLRAEKMLPYGMNEVKKIRGIKIPKGYSSTKIIGFTEIKSLLDKKQDKEQTVEQIVIKTRQYAKRQATWARGKMKNWKTINTLDKKISLKKLFN